MAYTPATKIPTTMKFFQWARVDAPNPRLAAPIDDDDTTLTFTSAPLDKDGAVIDGDFLMNVKNSNSFTELIYVPSGEMSADGLTATNVIRGVRITGLDFTTGDPDFADSHGQDSPVGCAVNAVYENILQAWFAGTLASGGSGLVIGTNALGTVTFSRSTGTGTSVGFLRWLTGTAKAQFSNDGVSWVNFDSVAASNLVAVSAADTTPNYLQNKFNSGDGLTEAIGTPGGDETLNVSVNASDLVGGDYGLETSSNDFRVKLSATPGLEFSTGLQVKVKASGGVIKDADGLSVSSSFGGPLSMTVGEDINGSVTPKACFISKGVTASDTFPLQVQETENDTDRDIYGVNYGAQTFTTGTYQTKLTRVDAMYMKVTAGSVSGNISISIYAVDGSSKPTGAALGTQTFTANSVAATYLQWVTFTFASEITVTPATEYAIVMTVIAGDASNYIEWQTGNGNVYSGGVAWVSADAGATWSSSANDFAFRCWGYEAQTAGRLYMSQNDEPFRGAVDGFVTSNTTSGNLATFNVRGVQGSFTGLTAGADYYVGATAGSVTTSTGGLKIGKGTSTTEIMIDTADGFVVMPIVTSPTMGQAVTQVEAYQVIHNCGFKPSKVDFQISISAQTGAATNLRSKSFIGNYVSSLNGVTINMPNDAAAIPSTSLVSAASSLAVTDGASSMTTTAGSFSSTNTGITYSISTNDVAGSGGGSSQAIFYR